MDTRTQRTLALVAAIPWLVVAGYGFRAINADDGDSWEGPYLVFSVALVVGALLVVVAAALITQHGPQRRSRTAGLIVSGEIAGRRVGAEWRSRWSRARAREL